MQSDKSGNFTYNNLASLLSGVGATLRLDLRRYEGAHCVEAQTVEPADLAKPVAFAGASFQFALAVSGAAQGGLRVALKTQVTAGAAKSVTVGLRLDLARWARENYVYMPAAVYNGNRYRSLTSHRSEGLRDFGPDCEVLITNVPRLNIDEGPSRIQLMTSDLSAPAVGFQSPSLGKAFYLLTSDRTRLGLTSYTIEESADRAAATLLIKAPGLREDFRYNGRPSMDRAADLAAGQTFELDAVVHVFDAPTIQALFDKAFDLRGENRPQPRVHHEIPFSSTWQIQHRKQNEQNWVEKYGYYSVGMRESRPQDWQSAWVGGMNTVYALLAEGDALTRRRVRRTFDFLFDGGQTSSGFIRGSFHEGLWDQHPRCFLRYSADVLFFLVKELRLMIDRDGADTVPGPWLRHTQELADAFCRIWEKYGQFGHYARANRDELAVGGTATASAAIGGLALAAEFFRQPRYLEVAIAAGRYYRREFLAKGLTNGGPGDIVQCPDSESCFALLESFATLYEVTGEQEWLQATRENAHQGASWVVNYDFAFPPQSTFGRLDMLTNGTVYANVQNKHSAPGLCTLSGVGLLKLYRACGDLRYLQFLADIAHAIPQYLSREDRPITDRRPGQRWPVMPAGWINERVNLSDWEVRGEPDEEIGVGEIFGGSTWAEPAMLLTWAELPGVYAQADTGVLMALDHVNVAWADGNRAIRIDNPTTFDAQVKLLVETAQQARSRMLGPTPLLNAPRVHVPAGQSRTVALGEVQYWK